MLNMIVSRTTIEDIARIKIRVDKQGRWERAYREGTQFRRCKCKCTTHLLSAPSHKSAVSAARHMLGEINVFST